jgi:hypothetical protein
MKVVMDWLRRLWWCARLDPLIFSAIVISLLSVVSAAQTSGTCECDQQSPQTRELVTTVWGGAVTILVLSFEIWSAMKPILMDMEADASTSEKVGRWFMWMNVLNPLIAGSGMFCAAAQIIYNMRRRMPMFTVLSLLSPWSKNHAKLVYSCPVVITVPAAISNHNNFAFSGMPSLSEAVVIGRGPEEARETKNYWLHGKGVDVLLQMENVLPPYDQLRVLQGSSGLATFISAVQSVGYIYGVVVRTVQGRA